MILPVNLQQHILLAAVETIPISSGTGFMVGMFFGAKTLNMIFKCEFCPDCCRMNKHYQGLKYCDKCNSWINEDFIETHWCLGEQEGVQTI